MEREKMLQTLKILYTELDNAKKKRDYQVHKMEISEKIKKILNSLLADLEDSSK